MLVSYCGKLFSEKMPTTFDFPDGKIEQGNIGARAVFHSPTVSVSFADIQKCAAGTHHYYLWGWVDYNDVFEDTPRRRSEFCFEVEAKEDPNTRQMFLYFPMYGRFNGTDADCMRQPSPFKEPQS